MSASPIDDEFFFKMNSSSLRTPNYSSTEVLIDREADSFVYGSPFRHCTSVVVVTPAVDGAKRFIPAEPLLMLPFQIPWRWNRNYTPQQNFHKRRGKQRTRYCVTLV
jgi:hypothetical protein